MILLNVWLRLPEGRHERIGEMAFLDPDPAGRYESEFRYTTSWLKSRDAFPLDPESLPLSTVSYRAQNLRPPLSVVEDALPDDWGRRLLVADRKLSRLQQSEPFLLRELGGDGLGALMFSEGGQPITRLSSAPLVQLPKLLEAADRFESGRSGDDDILRCLFVAGSPPGGARPKALVDDEQGSWIAKFPSRYKDGRFDVVGLEAASMKLAHIAGLDAPEIRLLELGGKKALLVRRFDVTGQGGRRHMISLKSLCREAPGVYVLSYGEVAAKIRKVASAPQEDVNRFFRQMVFNAALGNTDDHLKNFWMLHDEGGYRLSPAFDLVPDVRERREHTLNFGLNAYSPTMRELLGIAKSWGVSKAGDIIDEVTSALTGFSTVAGECRVPEENIKEFSADIAARCAKMAGDKNDGGAGL